MRGFQQLGLDLAHPVQIPGVAIVFAQAPENRTRLQHVVAEILHESVVMLLLQKIPQRSARDVVPAHGIHELDDGGTLRTDRVIDADLRGQGSGGFETVGDQVQMQQTRLDHLVQTFLRHPHLGRAVELRPPESTGFLQSGVEIPAGQSLGPLGRDRPVRDEEHESRLFARREQNRNLFLRKRPAVEFPHEKNLARFEPAPSLPAIKAVVPV